MIVFRVSDMTCGRCASRIKAAVKTIDDDAGVHVNLEAKLVEIDSSLGSKQFRDAIEESGYTAVSAEASIDVKAAKASCCGCSH